MIHFHIGEGYQQGSTFKRHGRLISCRWQSYRSIYLQLVVNGDRLQESRRSMLTAGHMLTAKAITGTSSTSSFARTRCFGLLERDVRCRTTYGLLPGKDGNDGIDGNN
jgi:hypothetical protein